MSSEQQQLNENDSWQGEHVHRYNEVLRFVGGSDLILGIACGTGFGSNILSQHTRGTVIGGDIAADAVKERSANWKRSNLKFEIQDGTKLPYNENYFDKIVSFETIGYTTKYKEMLRKFRRVLKQDGIVFISTPNFPVNSPTGKLLNPYHTQEFTYVELKTLLNEIFSDVKITGQKYSRYDDGKVSKSGKLI